MSQPKITCGPRRYRNQAEFARWFELNAIGFGPWYSPAVPPRRTLHGNRHVANCLGALFPDFLHELRDEHGQVVGYLATVPGYWPGGEHALHTLEYIDEAFRFGRLKLIALTLWYLLTREWLPLPRLFEWIAGPVRASRMRGANVVFLISMLIEPAYRKHGLTQALVDRTRQTARALGYRAVVAPFRPNAYGEHKAAQQATHTDDLFATYCGLTNEHGLPADPWLRAVVRMGARLIRPVSRSLVVPGALEEFEQLRKTYKPTAWYSPSPDVWECGETCTWYVDRARDKALAIESNMWGVFELGDTPTQVSAQPRGA